MTFELSFFYELTHDLLAEDSTQTLEHEALQHNIAAEVKRVKACMVQTVFSHARQKEVERYISHHQHTLIILADLLATRMASQSEARHTISCLYRAIEAVLFFIETYFSRYFDLDAKIPDRYRMVAARDLKSRQAKLLGVFRNHINPTLLDLSFAPLHEFIDFPQYRDISFRRLIWLKELLRELSQLAKQAKEVADLEEAYFLRLCYLNLNSLGFYNYCVARCKTELGKETSHNGQMKKLTWMIKVVNQFQQKPGFALRVNRPSLKEQLACWLSEEMHYRSQHQSANGLPPPYKVATAVSVPQLAYLLRILVEMNIIKTANQSELIQFFAGHFMSAHTQAISPASFRSKYYNTERAAAQAVRDLLLQMVHHSKRMIP